jgi:scyllo-inositol 2-dehydrogenase (NADP+)
VSGAPGELRVAVVGYGLAGSVFHAPLVAATPGLSLTTVVTGDPERAARARREHRGVRVEARPERVWERAQEHDLAVIATPNASHVELASGAIDADLAVVVDKPLAPTSDEARGLVERAERRGVALTVFHNRRWDSDQLTLRRLIAEGALGRVRRYESRYERWRPRPRPGAWRETTPVGRGGGLLLDLGTHLIDQALTLFGPVRSVHGEVDARRGELADDDAFLALTHESGVRSHVWASSVCAAPGPRLRVLGSEAAYLVDELDGQEEALARGDRPAPGREWGVEPPRRWGRLVRGQSSEPVRSEPGAWPDFYAELEASLRAGSAPPVDAADAVTVLELLERARLDSGSP